MKNLFNCPWCTAPIKLPVEQVGQVFICPVCKRRPFPFRIEVGEASTATIKYMQPNRGPLVLILGIAGFLCGIFAPLAWIVGYQHLTSMNEGRMDPNGRGLTLAGMILGIIWCILLLLLVLLNLASLFLIRQ